MLNCYFVNIYRKYWYMAYQWYALVIFLPDSSDINDRTLENGIHNSSPTASAASLVKGRSASQSQLDSEWNYDSLKSLGSCVVACHFCQADNNITCMVPEFVHSVAAYLANAPQLVAYREHLLQDPHLQSLLSIRSCIQDPSKAFIIGVLEPLVELKRSGKISASMCLLLVDSLSEAEFHKPDYGDTIASFLTKHLAKFPSWLKLVVSVRSILQDLCKFLPFHRVSLDKVVANDCIQRDIKEYANYRISMSAEIRKNIAFDGRLEATTQTKFCGHLQSLSRGCFLYSKLLLDLIEQGYLVLKSSNYKILPVNLSEVFLLQFNLKFPTIRSFEKVTPILNIALASLYPLTAEEIYQSVNSGYLHRYVDWEDFSQRLDILSHCLVRRQDSTYMFFHPAFREWLIRRDENNSAKFLCDLR